MTRYRIGDRTPDVVMPQRPGARRHGHGPQPGEVAWTERLLAASRARILAGCTEPGNAPVGAPYPFNPDAEEATRP